VATAPVRAAPHPDSASEAVNGQHNRCRFIDPGHPDGSTADRVVPATSGETG